MTNEDFESLVAKLEEKARDNPSSYQFRVLVLALLGNVYLGAIVILLMLVLLGAFAAITLLKALAVKLIIIVGCFLVAIVRALWVTLAPPEGTEITARQAPALFEMINGLRNELGAPKFHHVLVTDEFNAGVMQVPRLGILGWDKNYLLIGLPLMKSLSVAQFKAVLAHEFGHLAKGHGRMSNWLYRQRLRWARLLHALEAQGKGAFLFKPFLKWYGPYFNAYSFPLARANEYEADATAVRLTSAKTAAEALTGVSVVACYLSQRFWPQIHKHADHVPQPNFAPYSSMGGQFTSEINQELAAPWLEQSLAKKTTCADTHPSLSDRLQSIGEGACLSLPKTDESADHLLGSALSLVTDALDGQWKARILPSWKQRHTEVQKEKSRLEELDAQFKEGKELSVKEALERARLTESVGNNPDGALEQFRKVYERASDEAIACYSLGVRLLMRDDEEGFGLIQRTMELDKQAKQPCCELLRNYCWDKGRKEEAEQWHQRMLEAA
jgi:Zn-dependent protease with chaperone function